MSTSEGAVEQTAYPPNCYFAVVCDAAKVPGHEKMVGQVYFAPVPGRDTPDEMRRLRDEIEIVAAALHQVFPQTGDSRHARYFSELVALAQMGLLCDKANVTAGFDALQTFKRKVVQTEAKTIKSKYLNRLGLVVVIIGGVLLTAAMIVNWYIGTLAETNIKPANYLFMLAAAMPAMWLSFASRKLRFSFEDLYQPEDDLMGPLHRVAYVIGFTLILALLGYAKVAGVFLGNFSTEHLGTNLASALVFGAVCGLSEKLLATAVAPHVTKIMSGMSQTAPPATIS